MKTEIVYTTVNSLEGEEEQVSKSNQEKSGETIVSWEL